MSFCYNEQVLLLLLSLHSLADGFVWTQSAKVGF